MFSCLNTSDFISVRSFKKKDVRSFSEQLLKDIRKLLVFLHKIFYLRFLYYKMSLCFSSFYSFHFFSSTFFSLNRVTYFFFLFSFLYRFLFFFSSSNISNLFLFYTTFFFNSVSFFFFNFFFFYFSYFFFFSFYFFFFSSIFYSKFGISSLPTKIKKFTVLRSPHTDKKSREQFELRIHKRVVSFSSMYSSFLSYLCYFSYSTFLCQSVHQYSYFNLDEGSF